MAFRFGPVTAGDCQIRQLQPHVGRVGILLDQAQILTIGFVDLTARQYGFRVKKTRFLVEAVQLEDIAQLDQGAVGVPFGQKRKGRLVMLFRTFFSAVAG